MSLNLAMIMTGGIYQIGPGNYYIAVVFQTTNSLGGNDIITIGAATTLTNNVIADIYTEIASWVNVICFMRPVGSTWAPSIFEFTGPTAATHEY